MSRHGCARFVRQVFRYRPAIERLEDRRLLAVFTVNLTSDESDANPNDGVCDVDLVLDGDQTTLRAAIECSNASLAVRDDIQFAIPGAGPHRIVPTAALPIIEDPVTINGYTQAGATPNTSGVGQSIRAYPKTD